ncbi:GGDEF domain-containing protein [Deinococcus cellulosilyticus]|uniref:GGDEF domain-containing protein n=1 Tax=Deinococcus cellulosilyticus (strain DSM 18568 / NBRC 106333 / KACC 11606 / 5516J-15) TaxID=1223518 RepID=A0A511N5N8_DEIC1|nr:GGDEF domain-containing protein [Deinococcus cellulosilyticus]GEM48163.1 hypothetical protein DC3_37980 [Deinococcus cellulosilyticus NBRC 106333 = KACC 11606]
MHPLDGLIEHEKLVWASSALLAALGWKETLLLPRCVLSSTVTLQNIQEPADVSLCFDEGICVEGQLIPLHHPDLYGFALVRHPESRSKDTWMEMAHTDALTGLGNRRAFEGVLARFMQQQMPFALVMMDLNRLKHINDTRGHEAGDHFIREVGRQLEQHLRSSDLAFRIGGDEFAVLLHGLESSQVHVVLSRMQKVRLAVEESTLGMGSFSAGVAFHPQESQGDQKLLVQLADERMYQSKSQQKNQLPGNVTSINRRAVFDSMSTTLGLLHSRQKPDQAYWQMMLELAVQMVPSAQAGSMDLWQGEEFMRIAQVGYDDSLLGVSYSREHQLEWYRNPEASWRSGQPRILRGNHLIASVSIETTGWDGDGIPVFNQDSRVGEIRCNINAPIVFDGVVYGHLNLDNFVSEHAFQEDSRLAAAEVMKHYATVCQVLGLPGCGREPSAVSGQTSAP